MILSTYFSKNYFHFNNSLFYNEYIVILTFLFVATILSVVIVLFSYLLAVQKPEIEKFFLEGDRARHESAQDFTAIRRQRDAHPGTLIVKIGVKESINLRQGDVGTQATAQIYLTNSLVSIPAPYYHLTANRAMADFIVEPGRDQDVVNEIKRGWHLHDPTGMSANLHTGDLEADNFDLTIRPIHPDQPLPRFGVTTGIITVRD